MKILVISDTHGNTSRALSAYSNSEPVDAIIHLGDGKNDVEQLRDILDVPVISVAGNCDPISNTPREILWECEGKSILLTHGDVYQVKSGLGRLLQRALEIKADAVLFGHTHQAIYETTSNILLLNPGALANHVCQRSYAVLNISAAEINFKHYEVV